MSLSQQTAASVLRQDRVVIKKHNIEDMVFVLGGGSWKIFIEHLNKEIEYLGDYQDKIIKITR